jgi:hypothetical protein
MSIQKALLQSTINPKRPSPKKKINKKIRREEPPDRKTEHICVQAYSREASAAARATARTPPWTTRPAAAPVVGELGVEEAASVLLPTTTWVDVCMDGATVMIVLGAEAVGPTEIVELDMWYGADVLHATVVLSMVVLGVWTIVVALTKVVE